jgi:rare lipoprotein A (peptidoglycan hydrolase)
MVAAQAPVAASIPAGAASSIISGIATWYGGIDGFDSADGMADGTPFNPDDPTIAASNRWPLGTRLLVCRGANCVSVCIRDRGGFRHALDLSRAAFSRLAPLSSGVISVTIQVLQ